MPCGGRITRTTYAIGPRDLRMSKTNSDSDDYLQEAAKNKARNESASMRWKRARSRARGQHLPAGVQRFHRPAISVLA